MALTKQISNRALILSDTTAEVTTAQTIAPYYDFRVNGVLEIPIGESFDASQYVDAEQSFVAAKISVRKGGTSEYDIVVKSFDSAGGDETIHINIASQQFTTDNSITTLAFVDNTILAERTLVMEITEVTQATPVEDFTLTIVSSVFADLDAIGSPSISRVEGPSLTNPQAFNLDANRALAITASGVDYASSDDVPSAKSTIGISSATAAPGGSVELVSAGLIQNAITGLGFTAGDEIYLGVNGALVDEATASAFPSGDVIKQLGFAVNATDMWVQIADAEIII
tara:strand:- start:349 stop:1200 length:852 start_codon:yes stop_codon:yes gene_type:complete